MKVVFEKDGWQIVRSYGGPLVRLIHEDCSAYDLLSNINQGCVVCSNSAPEHMQALVALHNWDYE